MSGGSGASSRLRDCSSSSHRPAARAAVPLDLRPVMRTPTTALLCSHPAPVVCTSTTVPLSLHPVARTSVPPSSFSSKRARDGRRCNSSPGAMYPTSCARETPSISSGSKHELWIRGTYLFFIAWSVPWRKDEILESICSLLLDKFCSALVLVLVVHKSVGSNACVLTWSVFAGILSRAEGQGQPGQERDRAEVGMSVSIDDRDDDRGFRLQRRRGRGEA
jgi:hypothetical protein